MDTKIWAVAFFIAIGLLALVARRFPYLGIVLTLLTASLPVPFWVAAVTSNGFEALGMGLLAIVLSLWLWPAAYGMYIGARLGFANKDDAEAEAAEAANESLLRKQAMKEASRDAGDTVPQVWYDTMPHSQEITLTVTPEDALLGKILLGRKLLTVAVATPAVCMVLTALDPTDLFRTTVGSGFLVLGWAASWFVGMSGVAQVAEGSGSLRIWKYAGMVGALVPVWNIPVFLLFLAQATWTLFRREGPSAKERFT